MTDMIAGATRPMPHRRLRKPVRMASWLAGVSCTILTACGGGGGTTTPTPTAAQDALFAGSGYAPVTNSGGTSYGDGGGDGSGGGSGDGGGDGGGAGAGGDGGAYVGAVITVTRADGSGTASAVTDQYGMISVKNYGSTQPLLFTMQGAANATYWDEAKQAMVPFPATQVLHAMVAATGSGQTLSKNVGITPLTEAAYQYAVVNLGGTDAWKTAANVVAANQAIATEFNRFVPSTQAITDITRLAAPARDATTQVFAAASPNNSYGLLMAGLVRQSAANNPGSASPGIDLTNQLALDLSDGKLDGVGPGNVPVAPSATQQAYVVATLPANVLAGQQQMASINGAAIPVATYALGGSVSGLTTSGLVLANGGGAVSVPANATSFSFGGVLVAGSTYGVTVQAQPTGLICTVANGAGTAAAADVTTPAVSCVPAAYTLGGSVSGLTAGGLVLADGSVTIPVAANATSFSFGAVLVAGSSYNVTVQTQPTGLMCTVANGGGIAAAANVTAPAVNCAAADYALEGSVSGLSASGLVLADGNATLPVAVSATAFSFGPILVAGSSYNITVQTQPTGLVCTVANGSGTAATADVTTPAVSCVPATYVLGGSVSGLTAGGLVLADGSATIPVAANATSFSFGAVLVSGSSYNVTVQTQPTGLICTVANGSGTVATADVTTPAVSCVAATYALGGSVAGLTGGGLMLSNGSAVLSIPANATTFSFGPVLGATSSYSVAVQQQPAGQFCSVTNGTGTANASDVTNIQVSCVSPTVGASVSVSGLQSAGLVVGICYSTSDCSQNFFFGNGTYTFTDIVPAGAPYTVSVQNEPDGTNCNVVSGGNGVAQSALNISVSCASGSNSVGTYYFQISGVTGSGTVVGMQYVDSSGTHSTTVSISNSADTYWYTNLGIPDGASYTTSIAAQPTWESCVITNGSGVMSSNFVPPSISC